MNRGSEKLAIAGILSLTFVVVFLVVTAITDTLDKASGFYAQGIQDSRSIEE